jgi:hypothetical protein
MPGELTPRSSPAPLDGIMGPEPRRERPPPGPGPGRPFGGRGFPGDMGRRAQSSRTPAPRRQATGQDIPDWTVLEPAQAGRAKKRPGLADEAPCLLEPGSAPLWARPKNRPGALARAGSEACPCWPPWRTARGASRHFPMPLRPWRSRETAWPFPGQGTSVPWRPLGHMAGLGPGPARQPGHPGECHRLPATAPTAPPRRRRRPAGPGGASWTATSEAALPGAIGLFFD